MLEEKKNFELDENHESNIGILDENMADKETEMSNVFLSITDQDQFERGIKKVIICRIR